MKILVINPGSTSTKIAVYEDEKPILLRNITHTAEELSPYGAITEQQDFRRQIVLDELRQANISLEFDAVIGRGGLVKPIAGGVYEINEKMVDDTLHGCVMHNHELSPLARICGSPMISRICIWHALNQRAIARRYAKGVGKEYEDLNLIICHLGGGISVAAHEHGRAIDANNALDGEGPFSPERAGTLPASDLIRLCFSGKYTEKELLKRIAGKAGLTAHLGTNNMREILERIRRGDDHARLVVDSMLYHTAKQIASEAAVLCGNVDAILLTGGMAHSDYVVSELRRRIGFLAPVFVFPGENEMEALALNALAVLRGKRTANTYE